MQKRDSITYSILQANTKQKVEKGKIVLLDLDRIMIHDGTGPVVAETLEKFGITDLSATDKTVLIFDHYYPAKTSREAFLQKKQEDLQKNTKYHYILERESLIIFLQKKDLFVLEQYLLEVIPIHVQQVHMEFLLLDMEQQTLQVVLRQESCGLRYQR